MTTAKPEVFTRKASGLVRVMSPFSAFVYNILTMGLIFPWTYLWAPGALPGGKLVWGILLAMLIEIPLLSVRAIHSPRRRIELPQLPVTTDVTPIWRKFSAVGRLPIPPSMCV